MEALAIDERALGDYLAAYIPDLKGAVTAKKFPDGQSNPTYLIETSRKKYVLRRKPPGTLLKSAHAVDREFRVMQALSETSIPVAKPLHLCADDAVIGSMFFIMAYVPGTTYWDPALPELTAKQRGDVYREMSSLLARLHSIDIKNVGLADFGKPGNYFARQISRWTQQYRACETGPVGAMDYLIDWLIWRAK